MDNELREAEARTLAGRVEAVRREWRTLKAVLLVDFWRLRERIRARFPFRICEGCSGFHRVAATWTTVRRGRLVRLPLCLECAAIVMAGVEAMGIDARDPSRKRRRRKA